MNAAGRSAIRRRLTFISAVSFAPMDKHIAQRMLHRRARLRDRARSFRSVGSEPAVGRFAFVAPTERIFWHFGRAEMASIAGHFFRSRIVGEFSGFA